MRVRVTHNLGDLEADCNRIARTAKADMAKCVRANAVLGNRIGRDFARSSAGQHGKHYPKRFGVEAITPLEWEYGPSGRPQGEMSFEWGSRNQPPHLDLNRSADIVGPKFARDVSRLSSRWFW